MLKLDWLWWIVFAWILGLLGLNVGCSYLTKGATADKMIDYLTRGDDNPQPVGLPAGWVKGAPAMVFPTVPGKDFMADVTIHPDGTATAHIESKRSGVVDRLAASALGVGDQAIDRDAQVRAEAREDFKFLLAEAKAFYAAGQASAGGGSASDDEVGPKDLLSIMLMEELQAIRAERAAKRGQPMTPAGP